MNEFKDVFIGTGFKNTVSMRVGDEPKFQWIYRAKPPFKMNMNIRMAGTAYRDRKVLTRKVRVIS